MWSSRSVSKTKWAILCFSFSKTRKWNFEPGITQFKEGKDSTRAIMLVGSKAIHKQTSIWQVTFGWGLSTSCSNLGCVPKLGCRNYVIFSSSWSRAFVFRTTFFYVSSKLYFSVGTVLQFSENATRWYCMPKRLVSSFCKHLCVFFTWECLQELARI